MGDTIITWNWANWITVGLMAMVFISVGAFAASLYAKKTGAAA